MNATSPTKVNAARPVENPVPSTTYTTTVALMGIESSPLQRKLTS